MATITAQGVGSNLDVDGIVTKLMAIERQPLTAINKKEASYQAKISAYGNLKSSLSSFQSSLSGLASFSSFQVVKATPGDSNVLTASATTAAVAGSYTVEVQQLAVAQKLATAGQAALNTAIGTGTLTFEFGTVGDDGATPRVLGADGKYTGASFMPGADAPKTVTIDAGHNTLEGVRDAINEAAIGVRASIINDGSGTPYRLVLSGEGTGSTNSMRISGGDAGLQALLGHNPDDDAGQGLSETVTAQDARLKVDGLQVVKNSNSISDIISGVTLNLAKVGSSTLSVAKDTSSVKSAVTGFAKAYNDLQATFKELSSYSAGQASGVLFGDTALLTVQRNLRTALATPIPHLTGAYKNLSQVGITIGRDGNMSVDEGKLQKAIADNFTDVGLLFAAGGKASDPQIAFAGSSSKTKPGVYEVSVSTLPASGTNAGGLIGGAVASGAGARLSGASGTNMEGLSVQVNGGSTGARGTVSFSHGYAFQLKELITGLVGEKGVVSSRTGGLQTSIADLGKQRISLDRKLEMTEKRYRAQFAALDTLMGRMSQTSSFLTQQLANLSNMSNS
ncbi:flagellar filament capping protein FliD [Aromatoleum bremense]|uniref:Flagellar hook-associated protein 2 n=1 Tax=Aromatoleum bremense TaxID=76115 RepID=A0ABX1P171_9RHOO|nr:flagellar filament capping protein FliD [Aromatoleum bremense]NMG17465.1 flagellar filament capping protein FliD [Aromatoleum bremense]QTQ30853.1 Flagellar hook-associated protein II [Aromatoleum bremense]